MTVKCWLCEKDTGIEATSYGDHRCPSCGVLISIYDPADPDWLSKAQAKTTYDEWLEKKEKEKDMAIDYKDPKYQGKFMYMPRIGETIEIDIEEIKEVKGDNPKFNFSQKIPVMIDGEPAMDDDGEPIVKEKDLGYHVEARLKDGKVLSITSIAAFLQVFKKHELQDGEKVRIFHKAKGEWEVTKI